MDLDPSADQARQWLRDELAKAYYQETRSLFQRFLDWLGERLADLQGTEGTGGVSLPPVVIALLVVLLVAGVLVLLTRIRVESRTVTERRTLLGDSLLSADQLRRSAEDAFAAGRFDEALLAWTRALARDAESRTLLPDAAAMTAHEVGSVLAAAYPALAADLGRTVDRFDAVAYGGRHATREDAALARATDAAAREARPVLPSPPRSPGSRVDGDPRDGGTPPASSSSSSSEADSVWLTGIRS